MDWFKDDFEKWGGGSANFIRKYLTPSKRSALEGASKVKIKYQKYDWDLNDWK